MAVDAKEFEEFFVPKAEEIELTFGFRAYRAVLELAESFDVPLHLFFDRAGLPILFSLSYPGSISHSFEALFIFATRQERTQAGGSSRTDLESTATHGLRPTESTQRGSPHVSPESAALEKDRANTSIASFLTKAGETSIRFLHISAMLFPTANLAKSVNYI